MNTSGKLRGVKTPEMIRLGAMVQARRDELHLSRRQAEERSRVGRQTWTDVEKGVVRKTDYSDANKRGIMRTCGWTNESWDLMLDGDYPVPLPEDDSAGADDSRLSLLERRFDRFEDQLRDLAAQLRELQGHPPSPPAS